MTAHRPHLLTRRTLLKGTAALPAVAATVGSRTVAQGAPPAAQATPATGAALVAANTAFALDLYAELRKSAAGNLLFSPYSVSLALAMTYAGARGETAAQMAAMLGFAMPVPALDAAFAALDADLAGRGSAGDGQGALRVANALWGERTYPFSDAYSAELERFYGAGLQRVDFATAPEDAREEINAWVADRTEGRIENIVPPGAISAATRFAIANAIWFYGPWLHRFDPAGTRDDTFHLRDGGTVSVPFMAQQASLPYAQGDGWQAVELPYEQEGFALTVLLPDAGTFDAFEAGLDAASLAAATGRLAWTEVLLYLPTFGFDFGASLVDPLVALGMVDAFDPGLADFSGMVEGTPPEPLAIGEVLHKAFIGVDEEGTEAAAATVVIGVAGAAPPQEEPREVRVDRPFLFAIRDTVTGTLLFLGRVLDPSG